MPSFRCEMRARGVLHAAEQEMALQQRQVEHRRAQQCTVNQSVGKKDAMDIRADE